MAQRYIVGKMVPPLFVGEECIQRIDAILKSIAPFRPGSPVGRPDLLRQWIWDGIFEYERSIDNYARRPTNDGRPHVQFVPRAVIASAGADEQAANHVYMPGPPIGEVPPRWMDSQLGERRLTRAELSQVQEEAMRLHRANSTRVVADIDADSDVAGAAALGSASKDEMPARLSPPRTARASEEVAGPDKTAQTPLPPSPQQAQKTQRGPGSAKDSAEGNQMFGSEPRRKKKKRTPATAQETTSSRRPRTVPKPD